MRGGNVAGHARKKLETETKRPVIGKENYLTTDEKTKRLNRDNS
jgi:hypothetical protein